MTKRDHHSSSISIRDLQRPLRVRSKPLKATLVIRPLLVVDLEYIEDLVQEDLSDRELVGRVLHHQIIWPTLNATDILALSDRSLLYIAGRWGSSELASQDDGPIRISSFQDFREYACELLANWGQHAKQLASAMQSELKIVSFPPVHESILKSTQWMNSVVRYQSQLDALVHPAIEHMKQFDHMLQALPTDLERIRMAMLGTQDALVGLTDTAQVGSVLNRLVENLSPALVSISTINHDQLDRLNEAFHAISRAELSRMSDVVLQVGQGLGNIFPLIEQDLSILTPRLLEPISTYIPSPLLIPTLPDVVELASIRSEEVVDDDGPERGTSEGRNLIFDFQLDLYLLNLAKQVDATLGYHTELGAYHKTCDSSFEANVWQIFTGTTTLKDRFKNIQEALEAHRRGQFTLSVPALVAQLEGIITDMLVLRGLVFRDGSKARRSDNRSELTGLKGKIDLYALQFQNVPPVNRVREFIVERIVPDRNYMQHGVPNDKYTADVSTHLLVLLYYFGSQLMAWERLWK